MADLVFKVCVFDLSRADCIVHCGFVFFWKGKDKKKREKEKEKEKERKKEKRKRKRMGIVRGLGVVVVMGLLLGVVAQGWAHEVEGIIINDTQ